MGKLLFRELQSGDIGHIAKHLRAADKQELRAVHGAVVSFSDLLSRAVLLSSHVWVATDEEPVCLFGVAPVSLLGGVGSPWMLGTERTFEHPRTLVSAGQQYLRVMQSHYAELFNYVDARNDRSIRWLKHLGFAFSPARPYGVQGLPFHKFELIGG